MRRLVIPLAALLLPAGCAQILGYSEPSEASMAGGGDSGVPDPRLDGGVGPKDAGTTGGGDGSIGPPGQCADSPDFQPVVHYGGLLSMAESLAVGDLDGDGHRDVVVVSSSVSKLEIHFGGFGGTLGTVASETFTQPASCPPGSDSVGIGDFDKDNHLDLAYMSGTNCGHMVVRRGDPSMPGKFLAEQQVTPAQGAGGAAGLTIADFNLDGRSDLAFLSHSSVQVYLARSDSPGAFTNVFTDPISAAPAKDVRAQVADLNGDGRPDIAWLSSQGVQYKLQNGPPTPPGSFGTTNGIGGGSVQAFMLGDVDGDGLADMIVVSNSTAEKFLQNPTTHALLSAGTFQLQVPPEGLALVDVNSDGRLDITARGGAVLQCEPGPTGTFGGSLPAPVDIVSGANVFFLDLDGNGKADALGLDSSTNNLLVRLQN